MYAERFTLKLTDFYTSFLSHRLRSGPMLFNPFIRYEFDPMQIFTVRQESPRNQYMYHIFEKYDVKFVFSMITSR